jgi:Holliday junction resolvase
LSNIMSKYAKGRRLEYRVRNLFRSKGYVVIRAAQSKPVDLVCLKGGRILLVECKSGKATLSRSQRAELMGLAKISGAVLVLAKRERRKVELIDVEASKHFVT